MAHSAGAAAIRFGVAGIFVRRLLGSPAMMFCDAIGNAIALFILRCMIVWGWIKADRRKTARGD